MGLTPYVTPSMLTNAPTGVSWSIIPFPKSSSAQQLAEQTNICQRATAVVDGYCNQILRCTVDNEQLSGPNYRITHRSSTGETRVILSRWPITSILGVQWSAAATYPRQWQVVPTGMYEIERPVLGLYQSSAPTGSGDGGQTITIAPGYGGWALGRQGYRYWISYTNGWPHTSLTQAANVGDTVLHVDDVTGWLSAVGTIYDSMHLETISVTSVTATTNLNLPNDIGTVPAGPGTITLATPLAYAHDTGIVVSTLPGSILWATMLQATAQAVEAGITSVSIQNMPGSITTGGKGVHDLLMESDLLLAPYRRLI